MKIYIRTDNEGNILISDVSGNIDDTISIENFPTDCEWYELSLYYRYVNGEFVRK